jgi:guanylate cyclase
VLPAILAAIARVGADPQDSDDQRLQKALLVGGAIMFVVTGVLWGLLYIAFNEPLAGLIPLGYALISALSLGLFALTRRYRFFRFSQLLLILLLPWLLMIALGGFINSSAVVLWSLICPLGALLFDEPGSAPRWFLAYLALVVVSGFLQPYVRLTNNLSPTLVTLFFVMNIGGVSTIAFILLYSFVGQKNAALGLLRIEQEKAENLLLNILPKDIAAILKNESRTIANHYAAASILFADMVGFTPLSSEISPVEMVELLNEVFSYFDGLVDKYGLEKIKTIGDCYMIASGVPRPRPDHAHALVRLALEMRDYLATHTFQKGRRLHFRIGINSGPVLAGVIGRKKFIYDLWGDAVNTASRMESHGRSGTIQITRATYDLVKDDFECEPRGTVNVKGKGEMQVWYVTDLKE